MFGRTVACVIGAALLGQGVVATGSAASAAPSPADAPAVSTWGPVKTLANNPVGESVVVDARGNTTVVWATSSRRRSILALRRPAGGDWGTPVVIGHGLEPQVAADAGGHVTVVWRTQRTGFTDGVVAARRPAVGDWSDPVRLSNDRSVPGYRPGREDVFGADSIDLAVSSAGAVVVAWDWGSDDRNKAWRIKSVYRPVGGPWGEQVRVTPASGARDPQVGLDADGKAVLVYGVQPFGHPQALRARLRRVDTGWTKATTVAAEGYSHDLAVGRAGNAVVVFTRDFTTVSAVHRPTAGPWGGARRISPAGVDVSAFALAMNEPGTAAVALGRGNGRVDLVRRPVQGPWSPPVRVVRRGFSTSHVVVALNAAEDTFLGWGSYGLYGKYRPHGGNWTGRFTISPDAGVEVLEEAFAEIASNGDVVVLWKQEERPLKVRVRTAS